MKSFEIMFDDLNEDAQARFLNFQNLVDAKGENFDVFPLVTYDMEDEESDGQTEIQRA